MHGLHRELIQICHGIPVKFDLLNEGAQSSDPRAKNHVPCVDGGLIEKYKGTATKEPTKFREYVITHDANYPEKDENGEQFFTGSNSGETRETIKREIIYVEM